MPSLRAARSRLYIAGVLALASLSAAALGAGTAEASATTTTTTVHYAVNRPLCSTPKNPDAMRCFGIKRVAATKGTVGAYRVSSKVSSDVRTGNPGTMSPAMLASVYGYNPKINRRNLTVAIVLWGDAPNVLADLNRFDKAYGLPGETARSFRKVNEQGKATPLPGRDRSSAGEIALDTQAVRAVCNTCRILLVEASGPYDNNLAAGVNTAVRLGADVVNNSYGTPEHRFSSKIVNAYRHPGVAIVAASGDSGWYGWDFSNAAGYSSDNRVMFPASSPYVVAVGGTSLSPNDADPAARETVWNNNGASDVAGNVRARPMGSSGGGCSHYFAAPAWQLRSAGYANAGCAGKRLVADMAMVADPRTGFDIYDSYGSGGWITVGGTSLSSPLAAGLIALAGGAQGARYPASALYANAAVSPATRYDVTLGANSYCGSSSPSVCASATKAAYGTNNPNKLGRGFVDCSFSRLGSEVVPSVARSECAAVTGLDGPTGVGTPRSLALLRRSDPILSLNYRSPVRRGKARTFRGGVRMPLPETRLTALTWDFGDHHSTSHRSAVPVTHVYRKAGKYTLTLSSYDSRGQISVLQRTITVK